MSLRCLLFTADAATAEPICQVLASLGVEGEHCTEAVSAVEKVTSEPFQIVIIDWDAQPEAGLLLTTARERKASARPLTLAIVSDDASVPKALQAGANSILRKPILINQANDTLTTARDLLRAKQESAAAAAAGASVSSAPARATVAPPPGIEGDEKTLRAGEFLQPSGTIPGAHFVTDSNVHHDGDPSAEPVDALDELEPVASSMAVPRDEPRDEPRTEKPAPLPPPAPGETRGLQWYLNARGVAPQAPAQAAPPTPKPASAKPELLGFDQTPSFSENQPDAVSDDTAWAPTPAPRSTLPTPKPDPEHEQKAEAKLFAYISGEEEKPAEKPRRTFKLKGPMVAALALAACAVVAAPQAPWHPQVLALLGHGQRSLHTWLNPQPQTTAPAPESHESFGRAGDEYKLPVAETIPDATTDPSQIHVVPVVDPTKKPTPANPDQTAVPDPANPNPSDASQTPTQAQPDPATGNPALTNQAPVQQNSAPENQSAPPANQSTPSITTPAATQPAVEPTHSETVTEMAPPPIAAPAPRASQPHTATAPTSVPSSLKSQMASMTPEASGNKPPEAAMQSIEPVAVTEASERALLTDQPAINYPANAKGQQGTVTLQVLIGRDGSVQDAKFLQGSLAFARTAIDGVKLWKFKPYSMNGRPVSVQTSMTMSFKPGS